MDTLYQIAVIEGFLAQYGTLPAAIREALDHLKRECPPPKRKLSGDNLELRRSQCVRMRELSALKRQDALGK